MAGVTGFFCAGAALAGGFAVFGAGLVPCARAADVENRASVTNRTGSRSPVFIETPGVKATHSTPDGRRGNIPRVAQPKTQKTTASVSEFINAIEDDQK